MSMEEYFGDWLKVFNEKEFNNIVRFLKQVYSRSSVVPEYSNVFKAFTLCSLASLKVVFLGLDPYPQKGVATGVLFGNRKDTEEDCLSPSLKVIREAVVDYSIPHSGVIFDITMEDWAKQGILMLNSSLTTELNKTGSHTMEWRPFISHLLKNISSHTTGIVYCLFGNQAQTFEPYINSKFNYILKSPHPAYYARINRKMPKAIFNSVNNIMEAVYGDKIVWYNEE